MKAKVFISCGQDRAHEQEAARLLWQFFVGRGFDAFVAIDVDVILDLNSSIIEHLRSSDYYLFVNFKRETVLGLNETFIRGSMFSNQELAVAYELGFDHMVLLNQKGVRREGFFQFLIANLPEFNTADELLNIVDAATREWSPMYSRQLHLTQLTWSREVTYNDGFSSIVTRFSPNQNLKDRKQRMLLARIRNGRKAKSAGNTLARLKSIKGPNDHDYKPSWDRSYLKASGHDGYSHTIWPESEESFDLFAIHCDCPEEIFLNSAHDFGFRRPIISQLGIYLLFYEIFSEGFPILTFEIIVNSTADIKTIEACSTGGIAATHEAMITSGEYLGPYC